MRQISCPVRLDDHRPLRQLGLEVDAHRRRGRLGPRRRRSPRRGAGPSEGIGVAAAISWPWPGACGAAWRCRLLARQPLLRLDQDRPRLGVRGIDCSTVVAAAIAAS